MHVPIWVSPEYWMRGIRISPIGFNGGINIKKSPEDCGARSSPMLVA